MVVGALYVNDAGEHPGKTRYTKNDLHLSMNQTWTVLRNEGIITEVGKCLLHAGIVRYIVSLGKLLK